MKKCWPSYVEMRIRYVRPFSGGQDYVWTQSFLWFGFEVGCAKRLEYRDGHKIVIYCVEPGGCGVLLPVRWVRERDYLDGNPFRHALERDVLRYKPERDQLTCTQIWTREARRAGVALYLGLRRVFRVDTG